MIDRSAPTSVDPQENPNSREAKTRQTLQRLDIMTKALAAAEVVVIPGRGSGIRKVLQEMRPAILDARARGLSNGRIADILRANGAMFRRDSIRLALAKSYPKPDATSSRISRRSARPTSAKPKPKPNVTPSVSPPVKSQPPCIVRRSRERPSPDHASRLDAASVRPRDILNPTTKGDHS